MAWGGDTTALHGLYNALQSEGDSPAYVLIHNCTFGGNRARGGLFKASNTLISQSRFSFTAMAAIQVLAKERWGPRSVALSKPLDSSCRWTLTQVAAGSKAPL